jgi:drug/metabolite transporter (DMT)-like permease
MIAPRRAPATTWGSWVAPAVAYQWVYNGINFLAFKLSGDAIHPLMVGTLRFGCAALLLLPVALWRLRLHTVSARQVVMAGVIGVIMLVAGQTLSIWGTHFLPAGVASVFGSTSPLFLALFAGLLLRQPVPLRQIIGVVVGFAGLALLGWNSAESTDFHLTGAVLTLVAAAAWAAGSLLAVRLSLPSDPVIGLAIQLTTAGLVLAVISASSGIMSDTAFGQVPLSAWMALAFLIVASTLIGYAVFLVLNRTVSPVVANSYMYVAPIITLGLSALFLGEKLTWLKVAAAVLTLCGVVLMMVPQSIASRGITHAD